MNPATRAAKAESGRRRHHIEMLAVSIVVIIASLVLRVGEGGAVQVGAGSMLQLPPLCGSRILFGIDCPGCGLTRCFVLLAHGRWWDSFAMNRAGWLVALALLVQIPYRVIAIRRRESLPCGIWIPRVFGWVVIVGLVGNWVLRLCGI